MDSIRKTFTVQQALVPPDEEIPTARVVLIGMVIHFLVTSERLFSNCYVRCVDQTSDGRRVCVGDFDRDGLHLYSCDDASDSVVGLASSRKF